MHTLTLLLAVALQSSQPFFTPQQLWQSWPKERFVLTPAPCLRPDDVAAELRRLADLYPGEVRLEEVGRSVQGRPIHMMTLGHGPRTVLLWSQMHGDEPSATPALLDIASFLLGHRDAPEGAAILDGLTLLMIPMLNPDGSEIYERRNYQDIDINRDALNLASPEGRILKTIRDRYQPILGFNLHDQSRRKTVGDTGVLATIAVLAVAGDPEGSLNPGRLRSQRACAAIVDALTPLIPGGIARFDEDWNPRAFGDNLTAWGTPVVLIESGGPPPGDGVETLTRLNFVAILTVLGDMVRNDLEDHDPRIYEDLLRTRSDAWADVVVRGGYIHQPGIEKPYRADLAFNVETDDRDLAGCPAGDEHRSHVVEIGDARFLGAGRVVDASDGLLVPPFVAGIDGWSARRWLSRDILADLARLGVGSVIWVVPRRRVEAAESLAHGLAGPGRASLDVAARPAAMPWLVLDGPPGRPHSDRLRDVITALGGGRNGGKMTTSETLELLSRPSDSPPRRPLLRRGHPASFVLLRPAADGLLDATNGGLAAVFIDGLEVRGVAR